MIRDETVLVGDGAVTQAGENPALLPKSRLQRETMRLLKALGSLDGPASQQAEAQEAFAALDDGD
jgi:hypothetical protein